MMHTGLSMANVFSEGLLRVGNSSALEDSVDAEEFVEIMHGDLGTYEQVLSAIRRRSVEDTEYDRLQGVVFAIGLFHFKMAAADAIWRIHVLPDGAWIDETSFFQLVCKLRPSESSRLIHNAKFRQQHELIKHVSAVLQLDAWRVEVKKQTHYESLEEWAASEPSLADIEEIANAITSAPIGEPIDEGELEDELEGLEQEMLDERMVKTGALPIGGELDRVPAVPTGTGKYLEDICMKNELLTFA